MVVPLIAGNIALWLHLALIGSALIYLDGRRAGPHFLMLALFSICLLVKPYFLIYALPLLLVERLSLRSTAPRSIAMLGLSILLAAAVYVLFWIFDGPHSLQFLRALKAQADTGTDLGMSFFGLALHILPAGTALGIHVAISAAIAVAVLCSRWLLAGVPPAGLNEGALFLLAYGVITLCNPRMKEYDLVPAAICLYLYFSLYGRFGKSLVVLSLLIAQVFLWFVLYTGASNVPGIDVALDCVQLAAIVLPLMLFFAGAWFRKKSDPLVSVSAG